MDASIFDTEDIENHRFSKYDRLPEVAPANEAIIEVSDPEFNHMEDGSSSTARRQDFKLTLCEYESIALRLEASLRLLIQVSNMLETKENFKAMREKVNCECEQMTLRVEI